MGKAKPKKIAYVNINDNYRLAIDKLCMTLEVPEKNGWKPIGYFTHMEHVFKRILYLETLNSLHGRTGADMEDYYETYKAEKERITEMFRLIDNPFLEVQISCNTGICDMEV